MLRYIFFVLLASLSGCGDGTDSPLLVDGAPALPLVDGAPAPPLVDGAPALPPCRYSLQVPTQPVSQHASVAWAEVSARDIVTACTQPDSTATTSVGWITVLAVALYDGGRVTYVVSPNPSASARIGTLTIAGETLTVEQLPGPSVWPVPFLVSPAEGAMIRQNDPTIGCPFSSVGGYGYQIVFDWTDVAGATQYRLVLISQSARFAALDFRVADGSSGYVLRLCGAYTVSPLGWKWMVSAEFPAPEGGFIQGPFSAVSTLDFDMFMMPPAP